MSQSIRTHYETHPYPHFNLLASVRTCDTYALNLEALWACANGELPPQDGRRILIAGCGSFSPYPTSVANPHAEIVALDLARANLRRARMHALLHGRHNIAFVRGDLLDADTAPGPFAFIDAFGVLHHLSEPLAGLRALSERLAPGGIIRMMVYNRQARQEEEAIRRALRLMKIYDINALNRLIKKAGPHSRLRRYLERSQETRHPSGLADALLHPQVTTFTVDSLLCLIAESGLTPLIFAHGGALPDVDDEVRRLRQAEEERSLTSNFIVYLTRPKENNAPPPPERLMLNPVLRSCIGRLWWGRTVISPRLGRDNPPLNATARAFLRRFVHPRPLQDLTGEELHLAETFCEAMFLLAIR